MKSAISWLRVPKPTRSWHLERGTGKLPDRDARALDGEGRDDDVDAGTVGKPGVDHGRGLVDTPPDAGHDPVDHLAELGLVFKGQLCLRDPTAAFDEDGLGPVHHDLAYLGVREEALQGTEAENVVDDQLAKLVAVELGQLELGLVAVLVDELSDPPQDILALVVVGVEAECGDQLLVNRLLDALQVGNPGRDILRAQPDGRHWLGRRAVRTVLRLFRKTALVELIDEQHAGLLAAGRVCTPGRRIEERSLRRSPPLSATRPLLRPNGGYPAQASPQLKRVVRLNPALPPSSPFFLETRREDRAGSPRPPPGPGS